MIEVINNFLAGATVEVTAYVYDKNNALADATAVKLTLTDPAATVQVNASSMTHDATGTYSYYYNTSGSSETGYWQAKVTVEDGTGASKKTSYGISSFKLA